MPEIQNGSEPAISLWDEEVVFHSAFCKQRLHLLSENECFVVRNRSLNDASEARWPVRELKRVTSPN